jgi:N-acetylmuramoyl-L-alanine amidase
MKRLLIMLIAVLFVAQAVSALDLKTPKGTLTLASRSWSGVEWVCGSQLANGLGGRFAKDSVSGYPVMSMNGRRVVFSTTSAVASVDGKILKLKHVPQEESGCLWLAVGDTGKLLSEIYGARIAIEPPRKSQVQAEAGSDGDKERQEPAVSVDVAVSSDAVRLTLTGPAVTSATVRQRSGSVMVTLSGARFEPLSQDVGKGVVEEVATESGRHVLRVNLGTRFRHMDRLGLRNPDRLILIFKGEGQTVPPPSLEVVPQGTTSETPAMPGRGASPQAAPRRTSAFDVIVIDPGHGGNDTGAIGVGGIREKDLTLVLAKKLASDLEAQGFKVILTRNTDTTLPLMERTAIANYNKADLFVSIHLNASPARSARGTETYFMSRRATDQWSRQLADKENAATGGAGSSDGQDLKLVLWDLAQTAHMVESQALAETIQKEFNQLLNTGDRGVRQAPFVVLEGAQMPAVLVEVAFLTNPTEAKQLEDPAFQDQAANALDKAIVDFKNRYENPIAVPTP